MRCIWKDPGRQEKEIAERQKGAGTFPGIKRIGSLFEEVKKHEIWELKQMQSLPLQAKIRMTEYRIREWIDEFGEEGVYIAFSGGKDSTVLKHLAEQIYKYILSVFIDTGLEQPSVRKFAMSQKNVVVIRPTMNFREVIIDYGYPVISKEVSKRVAEYRKYENTDKIKETYAYKEFNGIRNMTSGKKSYHNKERYKFLLEAPFLISHQCCIQMKEKPCVEYERQHMVKPILGTMAEESRARQSSWLASGCNAFHVNRPTSQPMSFWTENDVLQYIYENNLPIAKAYGEVIVKGTENGQMCIADVIGDYRDCQYTTTGYKRTGCIFCMFGIMQDKYRFIRLAKQEPELCDYVMRGGEFNEQVMWQPSKSGLGYWFVIEWLNVHGNLKIGMPDRERYLLKYQTEETRKYLK